MEPEQWMSPPLPSLTCPPGLEMFEILDTVQIQRTNMMASTKGEMKAKNSGGQLVYNMVGEVVSSGAFRIPNKIVFSAFDQNGLEPFGGEFIREGCCGGCRGSLCACHRAREFSVHIPRGSEVATVTPKFSLTGIKYEVDNQDTTTKWCIYSDTCMLCNCSGIVKDFDITDETNRRPLGKIRKVSDMQSDLTFKAFTYAVDFEPGLDAKTKAKVFTFSMYIAGMYYEYPIRRRMGRQGRY